MGVVIIRMLIICKLAILSHPDRSDAVSCGRRHIAFSGGHVILIPPDSIKPQVAG
jgi:hypothetical protein